LKKLVPYFLLLISVLLTGCEHAPENNSSTPLAFSMPDSDEGYVKTTDFSLKSAALEEGAALDGDGDVIIPVKVDLPKNDLLYGLFSSANMLSNAPENNSSAPSTPLAFSMPDSDEGYVKTTDFSLKSATLDGDGDVITPVKVDLPKNDLLYGLGGDVRSFTFEEVFGSGEVFESNVKGTNFSPKNTTLEGKETITPIKMDLLKNDLFYGVFSSEGGQESTGQTLTFFEKQEKIDAIKRSTATSRKNNIVADRVRNKDVDTQLAIDLANLMKKEKNIPIVLAQTMKKELAHKTSLLDAETELKVAEVKMSAHTKSDAVVARIEDRVLRAKSSVGKGLVKEMLVNAPGEYYNLRIKSKKLQAKYQVDIAKVKLQYQQKLDIINNDVKFLRDANKSIISTRVAELEEQRVAEALIIEQEIKAKNQAIVDQLYPEFKIELAKYIDTTSQRLERTEKKILDKLESNRLREELAREARRKSEKRKYISDVNNQIKKEQADYRSQSRDRLFSARDEKIESIINNSKRSIKRVESNAVQALADLKAQHIREIQKQKSVLQVPYKKKKQVLNQKSQQVRSKVLSRSSAENYAILAKEKKKTGAINREIDTRVRTEIKAALDSFKGIKKDKADPKTAKTANTLEPEAPSGFFSSWF